METTPGKRVQQLREAKGFKTLTAFSEQTSIEVGTLSALEKDKSAPSLATLAKLVQTFPDLNPDWLLLGTGSMLRDGRTLTPAPTPEPPTPAAPTEPGAAKMWISPLTLEEIAGLQSEVQHLRRELSTANTTIEKLWGQNDVLIKKPSASPDAADLYDVIDQIQSEHLAKQAEMPDIRRFPKGGLCKVVRMEVAGFGRQQA